MSLDITFYRENEVDDASYNITHNMNVMAEHIPLQNGYTLYDMLWRGDEMSPKINKAYQMTDSLIEAIKYLALHKNELIQYNPSNGWGNFDCLFDFVGRCLVASIAYPDDYVSYSI